MSIFCHFEPILFVNRDCNLVVPEKALLRSNQILMQHICVLMSREQTVDLPEADGQRLKDQPVMALAVPYLHRYASPDGMRSQESCFEDLARHRFAEQEALHFVAVQQP